jgi:hypothetical protein
MGKGLHYCDLLRVKGSEFATNVGGEIHRTQTALPIKGFVPLNRNRNPVALVGYFTEYKNDRQNK